MQCQTRHLVFKFGFIQKPKHARVKAFKDLKKICHSELGSESNNGNMKYYKIFKI